MESDCWKRLRLVRYVLFSLTPHPSFLFRLGAHRSGNGPILVYLTGQLCTVAARRVSQVSWNLDLASEPLVLIATDLLNQRQIR